MIILLARKEIPIGIRFCIFWWQIINTQSKKLPRNHPELQNLIIQWDVLDYRLKHHFPMIQSSFLLIYYTTPKIFAIISSKPTLVYSKLMKFSKNSNNIIINANLIVWRLWGKNRRQTIFLGFSAYVSYTKQTMNEWKENIIKFE